MPETQACPECGAVVAQDAPGRLCPACLMRVGMEETSAHDRPGHTSLEVTTDFVSGAPPSGGSDSRDSDLPNAGETFGRYRLLSTLGQGGMGAVYEAEEVETGRIVALKLLKQAIRDRDGRKRFFREGRLAASLNHPNSVYVYGTEEIDGTPVISMERVVGGTLADRVDAAGPMPVAEAVDAILQVIDGLEAAADVGVLHRDIKPSNCFVDESGAVKIGDFGLSVSTSGRGDSHLTVQGSFLGTPAFASPEQLRGDELDVRSDIYAVGVTLFYLLTGRTPHEAENMVQLLATVLEKEPPSPRALRGEVPRGLARVVLRCLAKQPGSRYKDYEGLRRALSPFGSTAPTAATLGLRTLAGFIDIVILWAPIMLLPGGGSEDLMLNGVARLASPDVAGVPWQLPALAAHWAVMIAYYALPEGLYGASIGKALCGLRVTRFDGRAPGVRAATLRTLIYCYAPTLPCITIWAVIAHRIGATDGPRIDLADGLSGEELFSADGLTAVEMGVGVGASLSVYLLLFLLFATARKANGYAAIHGLATRTRVVGRRRASNASRPQIAAENDAVGELSGKEMLGPYHVLRRLDTGSSVPLWLGYDTRLLRQVWVRECPAEDFDLRDPRINVGRPGRLRWIGSWTEGDRRFVAYEALTGASLSELCESTQPWASVRYWLHDLATELRAAESDGTLPDTLSLDRVWITADGRAKLLHFPAPFAKAVNADPSPADLLRSVASTALGWKPDLTAREWEGAQLPVHAVETLQGLAERPLGESVEALGDATRKKSRVSRRKRFAMLLAIAVVPGWFGVPLMWGAVSAAMGVADRNGLFAEIAPLRDALAAMAALDEGAVESGASVDDWAVYIRGRFRNVVDDEMVWNCEKATVLIPQEHRELAERLMAEPAPSWEDYYAAFASTHPDGGVLSDPTVFADKSFVDQLFLMVLIAWFFFATLPSGVAALVHRRGWIARTFGVDYVDVGGTKAHRGLLIVRVLLIPLAFTAMLLFATTPVVHVGFSAAYGPSYPSGAATLWSTYVNIGLLVVLTTVSSLMKHRGLHDKIAGVHPVPH